MSWWKTWVPAPAGSLIGRLSFLTCRTGHCVKQGHRCWCPAGRRCAGPVASASPRPQPDSQTLKSTEVSTQRGCLKPSSELGSGVTSCIRVAHELSWDSQKVRMEDLGPNLYQALPRGELALLPQAFGFPHPPEPAPHSPLAPSWVVTWRWAPACSFISS